MDLDQQAKLPLKQFFRFIGGSILFLFFATQSFSAQNTQVEAIGYSDQGRYFAYEEFGQNEATGEAFSAIYLIDLVQITQVIGTPIRYQSDANSESLLQIRQKVRANAQVFFQSLQISRPGIIAALIGDGQPGIEKFMLEFGVPQFEGTQRILGKYALVLESFETAATLQCADYTQSAPLGFKLEMINFGTGRVIYEDKMLPRSRGCPIEYAIHSIILPFGATDISKSVGLISVLTQGPEGLNRHYVAVPLAFGIQGIN